MEGRTGNARGEVDGRGADPDDLLPRPPFEVRSLTLRSLFTPAICFGLVLSTEGYEEPAGVAKNAIISLVKEISNLS